jgi:mono/diheme cytochrome c family protein
VIAAVALAGCSTDAEERASTKTTQHPGLKVFQAMGCGSCHRLAAAKSTGSIGPSLDSQVAGWKPGAIRAAVVDPPAGSVMPRDFESRMSARELDDLAAFLDQVTD